MRVLFSLFTLLITISSFVVGLIWVLAKVLGQASFNPGSKAWKSTLDSMRTRLQSSGMLVPWDGEMLSLLSLNQRVSKKAGWLDNTSEGVFTSIYQEPVLAYVERKSGTNAVLLARTTDREFVFRRKGKETEIWVNSQPLGTYVDGVLLSSDTKSRLLARVEIEAGEAQYPVLLGAGTAASITNPALPNRSPNPRALTLLRDLQPEEESALLALTVLQMMK